MAFALYLGTWRGSAKKTLLAEFPQNVVLRAAIQSVARLDR